MVAGARRLPQIGAEAVIQNLAGFRRSVSSVNSGLSSVQRSAQGSTGAGTQLSITIQGITAPAFFALSTAANLAAGAIRSLTSSFTQAIAGAISTNAQLEQLQLSLETLSRRELERGEVVERTSESIRELTDEEIARIDELVVQRARLESSLEREQEAYLEIRDDSEASGTAIAGQAAEVRILTRDLAAVNGELEQLSGLEGQTFTQTWSERIRRTDVSMEEVTNRANELMVWIRQMSVATPFSVETLGSAIRMGMNYGFTADEAQRYVIAAGNVTSAMGGQQEMVGRIMLALSQMSAEGRVNSRDMLQLTQAGVPAWEMLADAMGITVAEARELSQQGLLPAGDAIEILVGTIERDLGDAMERQSRSWSGMSEAIRESLSLFAADVTLPLFEKLHPLLEGIMDVLSSPEFQESAIRISEAIAGLFDAVVGLAGAGDISPIFAGLSQIDIPSGIEGALGAIEDVLLIGESISRARDVSPLEGLMMSLVDVPEIETALGGLFDSFENLGAAFIEQAPAVQEAIGQMFGELGATLETLAPGIIESVSGAVNSLAELWREHGDEIIQGLTIVFSLVGTIVMGAVSLIIGVVSSLIEIVSGIIGAVISIFQGDFDRAGEIIVEAFRSAGESLWGVIVSILESIANLFGTSLAELGAMWSENWNNFVTILSMIWEIISTALFTAFETISSNIFEALNNIATTITGFRDNLFTAAQDMIQGLIDGIVAMAGAVVGAIRDVIDGAIQGARDLLQAESPSRVFFQFGAGMPIGTAQGIIENAMLPAQAVKSFIGAAVSQASASMVPMSAPAPVVAGGSSTTTIDRSFAPTINVDQRPEEPTSMLNDLILFDMMRGG